MLTPVANLRLRRPILAGAKGLRPHGASPDDDRPAKAGKYSVANAADTEAQFNERPCSLGPASSTKVSRRPLRLAQTSG